MTRVTGVTGDGPDEELAAIQAELETSGVWVHPSLATELDEAEVAALREQVAEGPHPVFLVVHPLSDADAYGGDPLELLTRLHDRWGEDGTYLAPELYGDDLYLSDRAWGVESDATYAESVAQLRHADAEGRVTDAGPYLLDVVTLLAEGTALEAYDAEVRPTYDDPQPEDRTGEGTTTTTGAGSGGSDGEGVGAGTVASAAVGLVLVLAVLARWRARRRRPRAFELPASVVARVRAAHDERLEEQAHGEVLALGEEIDRTTLDPRHDATAWQQALDHYDAAKRVLERSTGAADEARVLDVVGALVLARRGGSALADARARRPYTPAPGCYLNPLHGGETTPGTVTSGGRRAEVPLCRTCRADLRAGRSPDVLDVEQRGRPVHYFDSGVEPWASTGYGALHDDLVERLHRTR